MSYLSKSSDGVVSVGQIWEDSEAYTISFAQFPKRQYVVEQILSNDIPSQEGVRLRVTREGYSLAGHRFQVGYLRCMSVSFFSRGRNRFILVSPSPAEKLECERRVTSQRLLQKMMWGHSTFKTDGNPVPTIDPNFRYCYKNPALGAPYNIPAMTIDYRALITHICPQYAPFFKWLHEQPQTYTTEQVRDLFDVYKLGQKQGGKSCAERLG